MNILPCLLLPLLLLSGCIAESAPSGPPVPNSNFDFEGVGDGALPLGWNNIGDYPLATDTAVFFSGKQSGLITSEGREGDYGALAYRFPARYRGTTIRLDGYMKFREVTDGYAGLVIRIVGGGGILALSNVIDQKIGGTSDWIRYSTTLDYPRDAEEIYVAGILTGQGTVWFDNFTVTIDGEDLQTKAEETPLAYAADSDHGFDAGSGVSFPELTPSLRADLELLGRVWGFLKYHHPAIARGERQWDYDLFRFLPGYLEAGSPVQRENLLEQWIAALGDIPDCTDCAEPDVARTASREWIQTDLESAALRKQLGRVYTNRARKNHYYASAAEGAGNVNFRHELPYEYPTYPDAGFRLLSLYRYWNMIRYYFPYVGETDRDWDEVLADHLPHFLEAEDELAYERASLGLIGEVNDTHAQLRAGGDRIDTARGDRYAAVNIRFVEGEPVVTDLYRPDDGSSTLLALGDVITEINGRLVEEIVTERNPRYPASNEAAQRRDLAADLLRDTSEFMDLSVRTATGEETRRIPLVSEGQLYRHRGNPHRNTPAYEFLSEDIGYVTLQNIKAGDIPVIRDTFRNTRGIITDIRSYPSTFVVLSLGSYLMAENTPFVKFAQPVMSTPGAFTWSDPLEITAAEDPYTGRVVVLVNELTQSSAEYTSMAIRAGPRTTVIGSTTAGADGNVSSVTLPGGLRTMISGIGIFYPDGTPTQRVGIVPDIEVPLTIAGIRSGRDEVLERAIKLITGENY